MQLCGFCQERIDPDAPEPEEALVFFRLPGDVEERPNYRGHAHRKCFTWAQGAPNPHDRPYELNPDLP